MNVYMSYDDYCKTMNAGFVGLVVLGVVAWGLMKLDDVLSGDSKKKKLSKEEINARYSNL